jgi:hypothetical protein
LPEFTLLQSLSLEIAVGLAALVFAQWNFWQRAAVSAERILARWSLRPVRCFFFLALTSIVIRLALLPVEPIPIPLFHDEFSYLLGAGTFLHLRLTNPMPPMPTALETIHVNMGPTYQSMYMPGTALLLTIGKVLNCPWISVLLITAVFCAAVYWMVSAWLPRPYALVASLIAIGITGSLSWWLDNYFCVALASLGAALVLGSLPRILDRRTWHSTVALGTGLLVLIFTRPYEGFCVAFPCVLVLLWNLRRAGAGKLISLAAFPLSLLSAAFAWLLYYNWRGTGHALLFPYMLDFRTYHITGPFLWSRERPLPYYRLDILRRFYIFAEVPQYDFIHAHPWEFFFRKIWIYYYTYLFGFGLLLIPGLIYLVRRSREGLLIAPLVAFAGFAINVVLMGWAPFAQYAAPAAPLLILIVAFGLRSLHRLQWKQIDGARFVRGIILAELMLGFSVFGLRIANYPEFPEPQYVSHDRAHVEHDVLEYPGKQLCLVRYTPRHEPWQEWVFNGADPENERLVWARSLGPERDREVIAAYPGREVWLVQPDFTDKLLSPYPMLGSEAPDQSSGASAK